MDIHKTSHNYFHTFCVRPEFHFQTQSDNETVILVVRSHPISQIWWIINAIFLSIALLTANYFAGSFLNPLQLLFTYFFSLMMVCAYSWLNIIIWFFNVGIITNERIVDIDFHGVIYKEITETRLDKIQDITEKAGGFAESFFDFGHLFLQTAGNKQNIEFDNVPHPASVTKLIHQLTEKENI
jgi:uncharacterized membrane protein YdbT with pleckstrin-like domain